MGWQLVVVRGVCLAAAAGVAVGGCSPNDGAPGDAPPEVGCIGIPTVAFNRDGEHEGAAEVVLVDGSAEGEGPLEVVSGDWVATKPDFSPADSLSLVVVRAVGSYESAGPESTGLSLIELDIDGRGRPGRDLTDGAYDDDPSWSPDGETIAFSRSNGGSSRLMTIPAGGGPPEPLLSDADAFRSGRPEGAGFGTGDSAPAWSPDGRWLAFVRTDDTGSTTVWTVRSDGAHLEELAVVARADTIDWHPDGDELLISGRDPAGGRTTLVDVASGRAEELAGEGALTTWWTEGDGDEVFYLAEDEDDGDELVTTWQVVRGHVDGDRLEADVVVARMTGFLYPYFGLDVDDC